LGSHGGAALLKHYDSLAAMVIETFPEYNLQINLFDRVPRVNNNFFDIFNLKRDFGKKMKIFKTVSLESKEN
jgi:hypothetical protein